MARSNKGKKVKLQKIVQKDKKIKDNRLVDRSEGRFYRSVGSTVEHTESVPGMDKFTDFRRMMGRPDMKLDRRSGKMWRM